MRVRILAGCAAAVTVALLASPTIASARPPTPTAAVDPGSDRAAGGAAERLAARDAAERAATARHAASSASCRSAKDETRVVAITGAAPLPAAGTAVAAILNLTITGPAAPGFWTAWPSGAARPDASILNVDEPASRLGDALALPNLVTVPVGADGSVSIYSETGGSADRRPARLLHAGCLGDRRAHAAAPHPGPPARHAPGQERPRSRRDAHGEHPRRRRRQRRRPEHHHRRLAGRLLAGVPARDRRSRRPRT